MFKLPKKDILKEADFDLPDLDLDTNDDDTGETDTKDTKTTDKSNTDDKESDLGDDNKEQDNKSSDDGLETPDGNDMGDSDDSGNNQDDLDSTGDDEQEPEVDPKEALDENKKKYSCYLNFKELLNIIEILKNKIIEYESTIFDDDDENNNKQKNNIDTTLDEIISIEDMIKFTILYNFKNMDYKELQNIFDKCQKNIIEKIEFSKKLITNSKQNIVKIKK